MKAPVFLALLLTVGVEAHAQTPVSVPLPFKAVGHTPEWTLDIGGGQLALVYALEKRRVVLPVGAPTAVPGGQRFVATEADRSVSVTVVAGRCADEAGGLPRPYRVTVKDGDLETRGCGGDPTTLLRGGLWMVDEIQGMATAPKSRVTLAFAPGGRMEGSTGCNRYVATYVFAGDQLQVTMPISTMRGCAALLMQQERAFLDVLRSVQQFAIEDDGALVLTGADGSRMRARRQ
ncbi:MAG TPA: META domain-containing protein [Luteitalea sp.]|nr:META domain-containing protein [Luteitalea sp.]